MIIRIELYFAKINLTHALLPNRHKKIENWAICNTSLRVAWFLFKAKKLLNFSQLFSAFEEMEYSKAVILQNGIFPLIYWNFVSKILFEIIFTLWHKLIFNNHIFIPFFINGRTFGALWSQIFLYVFLFFHTFFCFSRVQNFIHILKIQTKTEKFLSCKVTNNGKANFKCCSL